MSTRSRKPPGLARMRSGLFRTSAFAPSWLGCGTTHNASNRTTPTLARECASTRRTAISPLAMRVGQFVMVSFTTGGERVRSPQFPIARMQPASIRAPATLFSRMSPRSGECQSECQSRLTSSLTHSLTIPRHQLTHLALMLSQKLTPCEALRPRDLAFVGATPSVISRRQHVNPDRVCEQ